MIPHCDNKSVGVIIRNEDNQVLLIERKKYPFGIAAPAGHIDAFASPEECAREETFEEVGLTVNSLQLIYQGRKENPCRRQGGDHHYWHVYEARVHGDIQGSPVETKTVDWYTIEQMQVLVAITDAYKAGKISEAEWERYPGMEPVWCELFVDAEVL